MNSAHSALPELTSDVLARLREAFRRCGYDADGVVSALGGAAHAALGRGEPLPALHASSDAGELGALIRLFLLGRKEPATSVAAALSPLSTDDAVAAYDRAISLTHDPAQRAHLVARRTLCPG